MNLFHNVFKGMVKEYSLTPLINTYMIAVGTLTQSNPEIYQQFNITPRMIEEGQVREMEHKSDDISNRIRRLMESAFNDVMKEHRIAATLDVMVSGGLMWPNGRLIQPDAFANAVEAYTIEINMSVPGRSPIRHRTIIAIPRYSSYKDSGLKLEWDRSEFPRPGQMVTDEAPVLVLGKTDLKMISTGPETIQDFAKLAIEAGWRTVQIHGTQLVLIK